MFPQLITISVFLLAVETLSAEENLGFTYNGFKSANITVRGAAEITSKGLLRLTNTSLPQIGQAFYSNPLIFKKLINDTTSTSSFSFSTTFVFAVQPKLERLGGHGMACVIAPTRGLPGAFSRQYLGLFNVTTNGKASNHVVAIELDTVQDFELDDINDNHVGIGINGLKSEKSVRAGYYDENGEFLDLSLNSGEPTQVWVEYDGVDKQINVTMAPITVTSKPRIPLLSLTRDLSEIVNGTMYVGFSAATGLLSSSHYISGWSFKLNGQAQDLVLSSLPKMPRMGPKKIFKLLTVWLPLLSVLLVTLAISIIVYVIRRKRKFAELIEDWELDLGPQTQRYKYKDLYIATKGFRENELLGTGGFGSVYRGILPTSNKEIAVKKVSHNSRQGVKEFVAEIVSLGRLRHRNLVQLLGYCPRRGELLLVYDFIPNGSLDKYLFNIPQKTLNWDQRFRIIKGVASGLLYLHEEWEQVVVHRDVKASNVLLDSEFKARLGDFGLARLYDHGTDPHTTHVVGTRGYMAPENTRIGKATTSSDVFAFGAFLLEVACGRRPIDSRVPPEDAILVDRVFSCWNRGNILEAMDKNLGSEFAADEAELVLKLGLLCSSSEPSARPSMRRAVGCLEKHVPVPDLPRLGLSTYGLTFLHCDVFDNYVVNACTYQSSISESLLSGGR